MTFFERNRADLAARGIDPERLPPGQYATDRFPVLHIEEAPPSAPDTWELRVDGLVERPLRLDLDELRARPSVELTTDIHCVTKWSRFDTRWRGVPVSDLLEEVGPLPQATSVLAHAESGYTANVLLDDLRRPGCMVTWTHDDVELEPEHGGPLRLLVPHLYLWKSVKWLRRLELTATDVPGFWERNGYHHRGDPFREQRFTNN